MAKERSVAETEVAQVAGATQLPEELAEHIHTRSTSRPGIPNTEAATVTTLARMAGLLQVCQATAALRLSLTAARAVATVLWALVLESKEVVRLAMLEVGTPRSSTCRI